MPCSSLSLGLYGKCSFCICARGLRLCGAIQPLSSSNVVSMVTRKRSSRRAIVIGGNCHSLMASSSCEDLWLFLSRLAPVGHNTCLIANVFFENLSGAQDVMEELCGARHFYPCCPRVGREILQRSTRANAGFQMLLIPILIPVLLAQL